VVVQSPSEAHLREIEVEVVAVVQSSSKAHPREIDSVAALQALLAYDYYQLHVEVAEKHV